MPSNARFFRESTILMLAEGVSRLATFAVAFVVARELGIRALAILTATQAIVQFALVMGDAGLGTLGVRRVARGDNMRQVVREVSRLQVVLTGLAVLVVLPIAAARSSWLLALVLAGVPLAYAANVSYVLQGSLRMTEMARVRIAGNVVVAGSGLGAAALSLPLTAVALCYPLGALVTAIMAKRAARVQWSEVFGPIVPETFTRDLRRLGALGVYVVTLYTHSVGLLLLSQSVEAGRHFVDTTVGWRVLMLLLLPAIILEAQLLPRYTRIAPAAGRAWSHSAIAATAGLLGALAFALSSEWATPLLLGEDATSASSVAAVMALQVPPAMASAVLAATLLSAQAYGRIALAYGGGLLTQVGLGVALMRQPTELFAVAAVAGQLTVGLLLAAFVAFPGRRGSNQRTSKRTSAQ